MKKIPFKKFNFISTLPEKNMKSIIELYIHSKTAINLIVNIY